jgi:cell wall-associated NlpC family hydrolase
MKRQYLHHPVANLRREPIPFTGIWKDPLQETQLLLGDPVDVLKQEGEWSHVQLPQQQKYDSKNDRWLGYPGWVETHLLDENRIHPHSQSTMIDPHKLVEDAQTFLNTPYLWGGASPYDPSAPKTTGVDCSGLVYLLHKMQGVYIPRDAHDQWLKGNPISGAELSIGDLVFIELKEKRGRIDHVMLYAGENRLIEAVIRPGIVREISFEERLGVKPAKCASSLLETDTQLFTFCKIAKNVSLT